MDFSFQNSLFDNVNPTDNIEDMSFPQMYDTLNQEQKQAIKLLASGTNMFITGNAGTGKSYLVKAFAKYCEHEKISLVKTAPTGIASIEIGGATLHHQFKLKVGLDFSPVTKSQKFLDATDVLLIDEISMVRIDVFERIMRTVQIANKKRPRKKKPIQIVLIGDFYQLAPVISKEEKPHLISQYGADIKDGYCFQSSLWSELRIQTYNLTTVIRQEDKMFCAALDACKKGDAECLSFIRNRASRTPFPDGIWVCGKNATVTRKNDEELSKLEGNIYWSEAEYEGKVTESDRLCDKIFAFKIGARVVMISNDYEEQFYQNGSLGTITGIEGNLIIVELDSGDVIEVGKKAFPKYEYEYKTEGKNVTLEQNIIGSAMQYPMRLGYAVTVHKSQGQTYDKMNLMPEIFSNGQLYVALSRCKSIENIYIEKYISPRMVMTSEEVKKFYNNPPTYPDISTTVEEMTVPKDVPSTTTITIPAKYEAAVSEFIKYLQNRENNPA